MHIYWVMALAITFVTLTGCKKEEPNPELRDPIYKDLQVRFTEHTKAVEEGKKKLEDLEKALAKAQPNTIELKDIRKDIAKTKQKVLESDQWARYYKIRSARRLVMDQIEYRKAFHAGKEWPDPTEYSEYLVNRRLVESPRNWNVRVPKLQDRLNESRRPASKHEAKKEGEEGEEKKAH